MTIRHMKIFLAVCEAENSTTKAAKQLNMSQPAVSLAIKELENYYGVRLFDRISRRLFITEAGKTFMEYASRIATLFDDMEKGLRNWDSFGILRVGSSITIGTRFMPAYVQAFASQHPNVDVRVQIGSSETIENLLTINKLDLALLEGTVRSDRLVSSQYMTDTLSIIGPAKPPYLERRVLSMQEFRQQRLLLREPGSGTRELFDQVVRNAGMSLSPAWEAMSTTALINATIRGIGIAALPTRMVSDAIREGTVVDLYVEGLEFRRFFSIVNHQDKFLTPFALAFIELCRNYENEPTDAAPPRIQ